MRIPTLAAMALASAVSLGAQTLTITPPTPLTNTRYGSAGLPAAMAIASNGRTFVAAWQAADIVRVARVNADGSANIGVPIGPGLRRPAIAALGDGYVVATTDIYGAVRLRFLDENGRPVSPLTDVIGYIYNPQLVTNGSTIVLYRNGPSIATLDDFFMLDRDGRVRVHKRLDFTFQGMATNGSSFETVNVGDSGDTWVQSLDADGNFGAPVPVQTPASHHATQATIASDGTGYLVAWQTVNEPVNAARLDAAGHVLKTALIATPAAGATLSRLQVAWGDGKYICAYLEGDTNHGAPRFVEIDPQTLAATPRPAPATTSADVAVAGANDRWLGAWAESRLWKASGGVADPYNGAIRGLVVNGGASQPFAVSVGASEEWRPAAASNGSSTFVAWLEATSDRASLMAGIIGADRSWLELGAVAQIDDDVREVHVATDGSSYLLTWGKSALRFEANGARIDSSPIAIPFPIDDVAWDGHAYVIVGETTQALAASTISTAGVVGAPHTLRQSAFGDAAGNARVATSGDGSLVSYVRTVGFFPSFGTGAAALALDRDLAPRGAEMTLAVDDIGGTDVAWNGSEYLVVIARGHSVVSSRLSRDGVLIDAAPRVVYDHTEPRFIQSPSVAVTDGGYLVTWMFAPEDFYHAGYWGYAAKLRADATPSSVVPFDADISSPPVIVGNDILASSFRNAAPFYAASRVETYHVGDVPIVPAPPSLRVQSIDGSKYTLEWTSVAGSTGYRLEYRQDGDEWQEIESWFSPTLPRITLNVQGPARFDFRVRALGSGGPSRYSNEVSLNNGLRRRATR